MIHVAIRISQPIGEMYLTAMRADMLVDRVRNRPRKSSEDKNSDVQRLLSPVRVNQIATYTRDPNATFPTPIILAVNSEDVKLLDIVPPLPEAVKAASVTTDQATGKQLSQAIPFAEADSLRLTRSVAFAQIEKIINKRGRYRRLLAVDD